MRKVGKPLGSVSKIEARPTHEGKVAAVQTLIAAAIGELVAADVRLDSEVMEQADRAAKSQPLKSQPS